MNINVETRWKIWACELGKFGFRLHPSLLHTPFNSSWCYIIIINIINEETWFKRWACLPNQPPKISDLGISGEIGADSARKVDTLAGRRVSSTPGKGLAETRRASHSASLGKVMTHPYIWYMVLANPTRVLTRSIQAETKGGKSRLCSFIFTTSTCAKR